MHLAMNRGQIPRHIGAHVRTCIVRMFCTAMRAAAMALYVEYRSVVQGFFVHRADWSPVMKGLLTHSIYQSARKKLITCWSGAKLE